jgi:hypothetical protein
LLLEMAVLKLSVLLFFPLWRKLLCT